MTQSNVQYNLKLNLPYKEIWLLDYQNTLDSCLGVLGTVTTCYIPTQS